MGIVLDIILLVIFALSVIIGYKKGLIKVAFSLFAFILALIITAILYNPITNLVIEHTEIDDGIKNTIMENFMIEDNKETNEEEKESNSINTYIEKYVTGAITDASNNVVEDSAEVIAQKVVAIGVAIILFVVVRIALNILKLVMSGIAELPILKQFNELGGTLYGVLRGVLVVYVILAIMFFMSSVGNIEFITKLIDTSILSKILYTNNIILNILF